MMSILTFMVIQKILIFPNSNFYGSIGQGILVLNKIIYLLYVAYTIMQKLLYKNTDYINEYHPNELKYFIY